MLTGIITRFKQRLENNRLKALRESLKQEFHKNTHNPYVRVFTGLQLLTLPLNINEEPFRPSLRGFLELRINNIDLVYQRLAFLINEYQRAINRSSIEWIPLPDALNKRNDLAEYRWLDTYFGTSSPEVAAYKLGKLLALIQPYESAFLKPESDEDRALVNQTAHLFRELETLIEHYLLERPI